MTDLELQTLADIVKRSTEEKIKSACAPLLLKIESLEAQLRTLPVPKDGRDGKDGIDGKDAPEVVFDEHRFRSALLPWLEAMFEKNSKALKAAVISFPLPKDGIDGKDGKDGATPHPDTIALMVRDAIDKRISELPAPKDGAPGAPGRDALELQIEPVIDLGKSYPRGTFARHMGSLLRSFRATDPMKHLSHFSGSGWDVIVEGIPTIEFESSEDLREFTLVYHWMDGAKHSQTYRVPVVIFRGVWRDESTYDAGDQVSLGGSTWHCNIDNCKSKPSTNPKDWTLATKRGQDGKDFRPPELPSPPKPIRLS